MDHDWETYRKEPDQAAAVEKNKIFSSMFFSGCFVLFLWFVQFYQWASESDLSVFGVLPGEITGLKGIFTAPLVHADFSHLISNSVTLFLLLFGILYFYRSSAVIVFVIIDTHIISARADLSMDSRLSCFSADYSEKTKDQ